MMKCAECESEIITERYGYADLLFCTKEHQEKYLIRLGQQKAMSEAKNDGQRDFIRFLQTL